MDIVKISKNMTRNRKIFIIIIIIAIVVVGVIWFLTRGEEPVACTMDTKQCPDGSYVGRVPPKCDFAPCPEAENPCAVCINGCDTCPEGCDECLIGIEKKLKDPNMKWYYNPNSR